MPVVAIEKVSSIAFIEAVFDAHERGQVVMPLDSTAAPPLGITLGERLPITAGGGWFRRSVQPSHAEAPAQVSLSSGTTGSPKAILLSHRALADVTERLIDVMKLDDSIREYVAVPVTFSFGFGRIRAIAAVSGAAYLPERGFRVDEFATMLDSGEVNALSAVPTLLRLALGQESRLREPGKKLRWLEIGSQVMSGEEKRAIRGLFPNARIVQHYGLTEASRSTFLQISHADDEALETVGCPNGRVEVRLDDTGRICVRGPNVASGIVTASGVVPLVNETGWLTTNDLGQLTAKGVVYKGRADDLINVAGVKVPADDFQERLRSMVGVGTALAVARGKHPLRGEIIIIAFERQKEDTATMAIEKAARTAAAEFGVPDGFVLFGMDAIPITETGKVRRGEISQQYAASYDRREEFSYPPRARASDTPSSVLAVFQSVFGARNLDESASFDSLGGDSLHYVSMLTGLEDAMPHVPDDWDIQSIGALTALATEQASRGVEQKGKGHVPASLDTVRGLACVLIVALHVVGLGPKEGLRLPLNSAWHDVMEVLSIIRLPLFTAIAGFLYAALPATRVGFEAFMMRKLRQLAIPLIFATLVFWSLRGVTYGFKDSLFWAFVDGYQHLWFIDALLVIFAIVSFIDVRVRSWRPWALLLLAVAVGWSAMPSFPMLHIKNAVFLLPYFVVGMLLYRQPALLQSARASATAATIAVLTLVFLQVPALHSLTGGDPSGLIRWICGSAWVVALLRYMPKSTLLEEIAAFSFTIYLWHPAANGVVRNVLWKLGLQSYPALFVIGLVVGVGLPILIHRVALRLPKYVSMPIIGR